MISNYIGLQKRPNRKREKQMETKTRNCIKADWRNACSAVPHRVTRQAGARAVKRIHDDITLDILWGLVPAYTGKVIIRRKAVAA